MLVDKTIRVTMKLGRDAFKAGKARLARRSDEFVRMMSEIASDVDQRSLIAAWEKGYDAAAAAARRSGGRAAGQKRYIAAARRLGWV